MINRYSLHKIILTLIFSCLSTILYAQEGWFTQKIGDRVAVNFPLEPKKLNETSYGIKKDDIIFITSFVNLLKITDLSLVELNKSIAVQEYADEFLKGLAPSFPTYVFEKTKIYKFQNHTSYSMFGDDKLNGLTIHMNIVFVDGIAFSASCILPNNSDSKQKNLFLANINISK
jgi:hypothetical protein